MQTKLKIFNFCSCLFVPKFQSFVMKHFILFFWIINIFILASLVVCSSSITVTVEATNVMPTRPCVLILSGWSDGPLDNLRLNFPEVQFVSVPIPTPPVGCRWLLNPWLLFIASIVYFFSALLRYITKLSGGSAAGQLVSQIGFIIFIIFSLRVLVARVVRYSINDGIRLATNAASKFQPVCIIGFSWGGGILWELLDKWNGSVLLLAPTISAMSYISRSSPLTTYSFETRRVAVVAGDNDPFCPPAQTKILKDSGCAYYAVDDDHVLLEHGTQSLIAKILNEFISHSQEMSRSS